MLISTDWSTNMRASSVSWIVVSPSLSLC